MKHNVKITILILAMFLVTQFIGMYVIYSDPFHIKTTNSNGEVVISENPSLTWIQPPEIKEESDFGVYFSSVIVSFIIAIVLLFLLIKFKISVILKGWFFLVVVIALSLSLIAILPESLFSIYPALYFILPFAIALPLAIFKIFKRNFIVHNITELLVYPGIAAVFVPILNFWSVLALLAIISIYDIWAVWHSGIMQKMAKYQINNLKVFSGFFVPYMSKKVRMQLRKIRKMKSPSKSMKMKKIKVNLAILGGGDIIFPIITAGVILSLKSRFPDGITFLPSLGLHNIPVGFLPALFVTLGATLGLSLLLFFSEKKKFYPAMPFITAGILLGMVLSYLFLG